MTLSYNLVHSAESVADQTTVTGLYLHDADANKDYILAIPTSVTISEGKVTDQMDITEVDASTLAIVTAVVPLEDKSVDPAATASTVTAGTGYVGLGTVTVNAANLATVSVKSSAKKSQTKTPTSPAIGFSSVTVEKFDGESGNPESEYANGDEILIKLPAKYQELVDRVPEFNGYYKAVVSDTNTSYANAQVVYADETYGPRIPMFDLIGKVEIVPANEDDDDDIGA